MKSNYSRTVSELSCNGIKSGKVERWVPKKPHGINIDLFGIIDLIALDGGIVGIQVTDGKNFARHRKTLMTDEKENSIEWLLNGGRLECWGWRERKKVRGKKSTYWSPRIADVLIVNGELYWEERK